MHERVRPTHINWIFIDAIEFPDIYIYTVYLLIGKHSSTRFILHTCTTDSLLSHEK